MQKKLWTKFSIHLWFKNSLQKWYRKKGNSLAVQRLGLCAFTAKGPGSILGGGIKILQATQHSRRVKNKVGIKGTCVHVCSVTQSCPALYNPMDCSSPGSSVHGIFQTGILEWFAISYSSGSSWHRDQICVSCNGRQILYHCATCEAHRGNIPQHNKSHIRRAHT